MKGNEIINRVDRLIATRSVLNRTLQDIETFVAPFRGEFYQDKKTEGAVNWQRREIYDNTALVAVDDLASQLHSNVTSPVAKWFRFSFRNKDLNTDSAAKEWLEDLEDRTWQELGESNFDTEAPEMYLDISSFGTSVFMMEDKNDLVWDGVTFNAVPVMDSYFEMGPDNVPYRIYRVLRYTQMELEDRWEDLPASLKSSDVEKTDVDIKEDVIFCVYREKKNKEAEMGELLAPELRPVQWKYVHRKSEEVLQEGGYYDFPGMTVRWKKTAGSRWGYSPATLLLSDIKQLNEVVMQGSEATAKELDPPMKSTELGIMGSLDNVPGGLTLVTSLDNLERLYPASNFPAKDKEVERLQFAIKAGFFTDRLDLPTATVMTAYEVQVRWERVLRRMAATLGRLKADFLVPTITGLALRLIRAGQVAEMPEILDNIDLDIELTGPLPRAMKGEITQGMEQWIMGMVTMVKDGVFPEQLDIVDIDEYNRTRAEQLGVPARITKPEEDVEKIRAARAEQVKQAEEAEQIRTGGEAAEAAGKGVAALQDAGVNAGSVQAAA